MKRCVKESQIVCLKSRRAAEARRELTLILGGKCNMCASTHSLEMDCIVPVGAAHHFMPWPQRIRFYWQQHLLRNLQLLCRRCHLKKTSHDNCKGLRLTQFDQRISSCGANPSSATFSFGQLEAPIVGGVPSAILFCDGDGI